MSLDIDMFRQQFRNEYLNILFWASIVLFVLSYNCLPTWNAWTHICKKKIIKQFLLQPRRNIYTIGHHDTSPYLLFQSQLISVIILKVREPRPDMRLLQGHQHFGVAIFHLYVTHRSKKFHTVCLMVADCVVGVDEPLEPRLKSVEHTQIHYTVGENCTYCILFQLLAIYHEVPHFNMTFVPPLAQNH